jgi:SAM-dependent methyltransferase
MAEDTWSSGAAYDGYIGRWSRPVAEEFVRWLEPRQDSAWIDVGCGSGALTGTILRTAQPGHVLGVDPSTDFIGHARAAITDDRAEFVVGDGGALTAPDSSADYVVSGLVLNFIPDVGAALAEMGRVAKPGGSIAAYVWDYADGMQMLREFWDAAVALDPAAADLDEAVRFPLCRPEALRQAFDAAGLVDIDQRDIVVDTAFADFDDYWSPFLSGQGPAPGYCATLSPDDLDRLREQLRNRLAPAGEMVPLTARAWAVKGSRSPDTGVAAPD